MAQWPQDFISFRKGYMLAKNRVYLVGILVLFAILVGVQHYMPRPLNWELSFNSGSKLPYGGKVIYELLDTLFPQQEIKTNHSSFYLSLNDTTGLNQNLVIISDQFNPDELDLEALIDFVARGNTAFISALSFGEEFCDTLRFATHSPVFDTSVLSRQKVLLALKNPANDSVTEYAFRRGMPRHYFSDYDTLCTLRLGSDEMGNLNFIGTSFGYGKIFLHCQPMAFTNFHLLYGDYQYACRALSILPVEKTIWDQYYKPGSYIDTSPVRYILSEPALKSAYYLILITILIYMIFGTRRKQWIVPVIRPEENASLKFLLTVGRLYFRTGDHAGLAKKKIIYFNEFLRNRYYLHAVTESDEQVKKLTLKSGLNADDIAHLLQRVNVIGKSQHLDRKGLVDFHRLLENFYKKCN
jgi:hypothetical protein